MYRAGFDNDKYLRLQSQKIRERIARFGGKLYLEFGGKLFDDYHASRVLPGFQPDSKVRMLLEMKDEAEIVIVISADDIERNKRRGDLGITYDEDALRLIDAFTRHRALRGQRRPSRTTAASPPPTTSASGSRPWTCASTSSTGYRIIPPTSPSSSPTRASGKTTT